MQKLVDYFITKPKQLTRSAGKFVRGERGGELFKGFTLDEVNKAKQLAREFLNNQTVTTVQNKEIEGNITKGEFKSTIVVDYEPKSTEELYTLHKIDKNQYVITNYWSKLTPSGKFTSSVFCKKRTLDDITGKDIISVLDKYTPKLQFLNTDIKQNESFVRPTCLFIDITDFHLDKRDIYGTTIEEKEEQYKRTLQEIVLKAYHSNNIDEIVFIIGSDFLHTDTYFNTTTKGTPQDTNSTWNKSFEVAFNLYSDSIINLSQYCNKLKVVLVSGNHGRTKEYYLAFALHKYFTNFTNVEFDITPDFRKCITYGNTFVGLHHGDCKQDSLPLIFAKEFNKQWGECDNHFVITGDKHHSLEKDIQGVILKQLPALTKADNWHNSSNFHLSQKYALGILFDKEKGRIGEIISK